MEKLSYISTTFSDYAELYGFHSSSGIFNTSNILDHRGLKVTSGIVTIAKDDSTNMIGISIGGGAPNCPCLYIVQVITNTLHSPSILRRIYESERIL